MGTLQAFAANHRHVSVSTLNGQWCNPGSCDDVRASFVGDGSCLVLGSILGRFPSDTSRPSQGVLVRMHEEQNPSNTTQHGCELKASSVDGQPCEHCLAKTN